MTAVHRYVDLVDTELPQIEQFLDAWDQLSKVAFYLSAQQCRLVNAATARLRAWWAQHDRPVLGMPDLAPDPVMNDTRWRRLSRIGTRTAILAAQ